MKKDNYVCKGTDQLRGALKDIIAKAGNASFPLAERFLPVDKVVEQKASLGRGMVAQQDMMTRSSLNIMDKG